jgi:bifunctional DNA-binding transcriptional regulator/antitoxin component of YhaV-PrlF toxin-antitoxin module
MLLPFILFHPGGFLFRETTKIGEKGQLTEPKQFRQDLGLGTGAPFAVLRLGNGLILLPEQQRFEHLCQKMTSILTSAGLAAHDLLNTLPEVRWRIYARHYELKSLPRASQPRSRRHRGK